MHGLTTNQETFDELIGNLDKRLEVYDQILSKQKYVAGEVRFSFLPLSFLLFTGFTYIYNYRKSPSLISSTFLSAPGCPQQAATFSIPSLMLPGASSLFLIRFLILMFDD
jgi:hypothetical protein